MDWKKRKGRQTYILDYDLHKIKSCNLMNKIFVICIFCGMGKLITSKQNCCIGEKATKKFLLLGLVLQYYNYFINSSRERDKNRESLHLSKDLGRACKPWHSRTDSCCSGTASITRSNLTLECFCWWKGDNLWSVRSQQKGYFSSKSFLSIMLVEVFDFSSSKTWGIYRRAAWRRGKFFMCRGNYFKNYKIADLRRG